MSEQYTTEQRSIQSIEVGFRLIRVLEEAGGSLPLKTISARAGMSPAKAHLYLVSFTRLGLIMQNEATSHYGLGPYAIQLGFAALGQLDLVETARAPLEQLRSRFDLPAYLTVWGGTGPFILLKYDAELPTPFRLKAGYVFPLLTTGTGRIFLAYLPRQVTQSVLRREGKLHPDLLTGVETICEQICAEGYAASDGQLFRGFCAISAPVLDHKGKLAAAVSLLGVAAFMNGAPHSPMVKSVQQTASEMSAALGYRPRVRVPG